jgi:RNA polymerase sigma factor (sigma-70 family)
LKNFKRRETSQDENLDEPPDPSENVEEVQIQTEQQQVVRESVSQLPERCRELMEMLYFDSRSLSYDEISQIMGMPVASIGPTRARCLDKLRTLLRRRGIK